MPDDALVAAGDIARLAGVGRPAVSNWRRRFQDFPEPAGGTSSNPLFSLKAVEAWLRGQGKLAELPEDEWAWQQIRNAADDLRLATLVGQVLAFLVRPDRDRLLMLTDAELAAVVAASGSAVDAVTDPADASADTPADVPADASDVSADPPVEAAAESARVTALDGAPFPDDAYPAPLLRTAAALATGRGTRETVEFLFRRYVETHSRRVQVVSPEVAALMAGLLGSCETVLDPSCGHGALLLAAQSHAKRLLGQERDPAVARMAAARSAAHGADADVRAGDALTADAFPEIQADGVVCVPPFNERGWGHERLANDPRWQYGLPPRGESELAWVQHCLAHLRPGGRAVVLMPPAAAARRAGRRIRSQLLRTGALQAVVGLPEGTAPQSTLPPHLWVLRRPQPTDDVPSHVMLADGPVAAFQRGLDDAGRAVPIIELLDDDVDFTPSRYLATAAEVRAADLDKTHRELRRLSAALTRAVPEVVKEARELTMTTLGELVRSGGVQLEQTPMRMETESGALPLLTAKDVALGRGPTGRGDLGPGAVTARPGDIVIPAVTHAVHARVLDDEVLLGPHLFVVRVDQDLFDPYFVAGFLRVSAARTASRRPSTLSGNYRVDVRRARLPRLPLAEQRRYGETFLRLEAFEETVDRSAEAGRLLAAQILDGLVDGSVQPGG